MTDTTIQITSEELKKMLAESELSDELKKEFATVIDKMTGEEKTELIQIIENEKKAITENEKERTEKLIKLNMALEKHLEESLREEGKYIREQFEATGAEDDKKEMADIEQEINNL